MSINNFTTLIKSGNGLAKPVAYYIELPEISNYNVTNIKSDLNLLCNATTLPGDQIMTHDRTIGIKPELMAYTYSQSDIQLKFYDTNEYKVKRYFDAWRKTIINDNGTLNYKDSYAKSVKIYQLTHAQPYSTESISKSNTVYGVELIEAFPTTITEIQLGAGDVNSVVELSVQLSYSKYKILE